MASEAVQRVLAKLPSAKRLSTGGWNAKCPSHRDRAPSLKVDEGADGRALLRCHAGCEVPAIVAAMGLSMRDLMPEGERIASFPFSPSRAGHTPALKLEKPERPSTKGWHETARYDYTDADGTVLFSVIRKEAPDGSGKTFTQQQPDGTYGLKGIDSRPLWRLPAVLQAVAAGDPILIVEGEKDVLTAERLGWVATTNVGGSNGWRAEHAAALENADVILIPDNDAPGRHWAETVASSVAGTARRVRIVPLPRVPEKGDLTDWVESGGTSDALGGLILKAAAWRPGDPIPEPPAPSRFRVYRADELTQLPPTQWLVQDVLPTDALAALVGPSGKGKTFLTLDLSCSIAAGRRWLGHTLCPIAPVLYIAAEGTAGLRARIAAWEAEYGTPGNFPLYFICETVNFLEPADVDHVIRAMTALPAPPALVIVDTLHRSMPGGDENSAKDVGLVITHADRVRRAAGCTVLIVHHSKKDADIERGSTALRAACDTLLMLRDEEGQRTLTCEKQKDAADFAPHPLTFTAAHGSVIVELASGDESGDVERVSDPHHLSSNERLALSALADAGLDAGLTATEWKMASGVPDRSFFRVRAGLVRAGLVSDAPGRGSRFLVTATGNSALRLAATVTAKSLPSYCQNLGQDAKNSGSKLAVSGSNADERRGVRGEERGPNSVPGLPLRASPVNTTTANGSDSQVGSKLAVSGSDHFRGHPKNGAEARNGLRGQARSPLPPTWVTEPREYSEDEARR